MHASIPTTTKRSHVSLSLGLVPICNYQCCIVLHSICEHVLIVKGNHAKKQAITLIKLVILLQLKKGWTFDFYLGHFTFLKSQMQESFSKNPLLIFFLSIHARNCCDEANVQLLHYTYN